jgi:hypothetical protein
MRNYDQSDQPSAEGTQTAPPARKPFRRRALLLLMWFVVCSGLLTWCAGAIRAAREAERCQTCGLNFKQIGLGLLNFDAENGSLPPAYLCDAKGKPIHSWRALLMPYGGHYSWRKTYSLKEPWDGPNNGKFLSTRFNEFRCPSAGSDLRLTADYVAVVGPDTLWPGRERIKLPPKGGNQDTILLIELPDSDYGCLDPRCPTVEEFMAKIKSPTGKGIQCIHPKGLAYVTVGGDVRWFPPDTDAETIRRLLKRDPDCKVIPPQEKMPIVEGWEEDKEDSKKSCVAISTGAFCGV